MVCWYKDHDAICSWTKSQLIMDWVHGLTIYFQSYETQQVSQLCLPFWRFLITQKQKILQSPNFASFKICLFERFFKFPISEADVSSRCLLKLFKFLLFNHLVIFQICDSVISTWDKVHFLIYLLNRNFPSHQSWLIDRYKQVK